MRDRFALEEPITGYSSLEDLRVEIHRRRLAGIPESELRIAAGGWVESPVDGLSVQVRAGDRWFGVRAV